jgi:hypothetical protein
MNPFEDDDREHVDGTEVCDHCEETCPWTRDVVTDFGEVSLCKVCFMTVSPAEAATDALEDGQ